jgi:hypothetical protein
MTAEHDNVESRLIQIEQRNRVLSGMITILFLVVCSGLVMGSQSRPSSEPLRVRGLIVEDAAGQARILIGSPIADRNAGGNRRTGIVINDPAGVERFGLGLQDSGRVVMGLDAPLGKGDDRNRERITLVADENGGSYIRFLDRTTSVPARLYLDDQNRVWLEFINTQGTETVRRRIGFSGEEVIRSPR